MRCQNAGRVLFSSLLALSVDAFYLPGSAPRSYLDGEVVPLLVNTITPLSDVERTTSLISYNYYDKRFPFCEPPGGAEAQSESLGSILFGDRLFSSPFQDIRMKENQTCKAVCTRTVTKDMAAFINERIEEHYAVHWLIDGLPAAKAKVDSQGTLFYSVGMDLGDYDMDTQQAVLNNHYDIVIDYHELDADTSRVVGVLVWPSSQDNSKGVLCSEDNNALILSTSSDTTVTFSYSLYWRKSSTVWATRWDAYIPVYSPRIHWFSLINSIIIALFLCAMVSMILGRAINKDVDRYNAIDLTDGGIQDDSGWKLLHAEVFRPPPHKLLLSVAVGSGCQLAAMVVTTLFFAVLGFLSPSRRGSLSTIMYVSLLIHVYRLFILVTWQRIVLWTMYSSVAGYISTRLFASLQGRNWKLNVLATATMLPAALFISLNLINLFLLLSGAAGAVPFGTMVAIVALWFLVSLPLTCVGSYFGLKAGTITHPNSVNPIPRQIPPFPSYLKPWPSAMISGIFSFSALFIEGFFILSSLFGSHLYYAFGFLAAVFLVVSVTSATVTILMTYFRLVHENYRWQWHSFACGAGSSVWVFLYGLYYWVHHLSLNGVSSRLLFVGYLLLITGLNALLFGSIGFIATYAFLRRIYQRVRID